MMQSDHLRPVLLIRKMTANCIANVFAQLFDGIRLRKDRFAQRMGCQAAIGVLFDNENDLNHSRDCSGLMNAAQDGLNCGGHLLTNDRAGGFATIAAMNLKETLAKLESLGDEKRRAFNLKPAPHGIAAGKLKQFGVAMGDLRKLATKIKSDHALALELWNTGNIDAQLLAILIMKPKELSDKELDKMVRQGTFPQVADWFNAYVVKEQPPADKEALRLKWMEDDDGWAARAGWNLTASKINKAGAGKDSGADGLDLPALLDRIEREMPDAPPETQWTMNNTLLAIGIQHAKHRKRAIAIGEKIGLYKDWPVSKGCTPPYAPIAITEMVKRQG
jgi:3-methyladenine DNA glycosylase AlkD